MERDLKPGDFLIFQLEAGFALLRLLAIDDDHTWHLTAYSDFFPSVEDAENAVEGGVLKVNEPHLAISQRAFDSTQVARVAHRPLAEGEISHLSAWREDPLRSVSDRSVRLLLGLR